MSQIQNIYFGISNAILNIRSFNCLYKNYNFNEISNGGARVLYYLNLQSNEVAEPRTEEKTMSTFTYPKITFDTIDIAILDSIYTMYKNRKMIFTIDELTDIVFVCKNANDNECREMISKSVNKLLQIQIIYGQMLEKSSGVYILPSNKYNLLPIKCIASKGNSQAYEIEDMPQLYKEAEALGLITSASRKSMDLDHEYENPLFSMVKREIIKQIRNANRYSIINEAVMYYADVPQGERMHSNLTCRVADSLGCDILPEEYMFCDFNDDGEEYDAFKFQCELILDHIKKHGLIYDYKFIYKSDLAVGFIIHLTDEPHIEMPDVIIDKHDIEMPTNDLCNEIDAALLEMEELQYAMVSEQIRVITEMLGLKYVDSDMAKRLQTKIKLSFYKIRHLFEQRINRENNKRNKR